MAELRIAETRDGEAVAGGFAAVIRKVWWQAALLSLGAGAVVLGAMFLLPNQYQAAAVIAPAGDEPKPNAALGALASFGISVGGPSKVEDLETLFRSKDLTARVFRTHDLWRGLLGDRFDPASRTVRPDWTDRLLRGASAPRPPGDWDAIRAVKDRLGVAANRKAGTVILLFESPSAEGAAEAIRAYLEEGKSRLQEEAFERANRNKTFIEGQIARTLDPLTRDRLYSLYGQEVEREMLARNRDQFGFKIVDSPRVPDRKSRPHRARAAIFATVAAFFACLGFALVRERNRSEGAR